MGIFFFFFFGLSFRRSPQNVGEVMVRTTNDRWIVGRKSDQREFYVIFDNKNAHLIEINEEVKKLGSTYFQNIFLETWGKKKRKCQHADLNAKIVKFNYNIYVYCIIFFFLGGNNQISTKNPFPFLFTKKNFSYQSSFS